MSNVLTGHQVRAYTVAPNGWDEYPSLGGAYNFLGIFKDVTINLMIERADVTPSSQLLKEKQITGLDWSGTLTSLIRSAANWSGGGASPGLTMLTTGNTLLQLIFQEEVSGYWISAYGGIKTVDYKRPREQGEEVITFENAGPIGTTGASLFYSASSAVTPSQANALTAVSYDKTFNSGYFAR